MLHEKRENLDDGASAFNQKYLKENTFALLKILLKEEFRDKKISLVSSFGAESAVLLHMVSQIDRYLDIIFLDTFKHFEETYSYRKRLVKLLGLKGVRIIKPETPALKNEDPQGNLHSENPNLCCYLRRVLPLEKALQDREVWITGRKHFQSVERSTLSLFEEANGKIKVNPLIRWTRKDVDAYFEAHQLPQHPLVEKGFFSIGCAPCTNPTWSPDQARTGRWNGSAKTECGIHLEQTDISKPSNVVGFRRNQT